MLLQVDLALEAKNLWEFNYNVRFNPDVRFPFPIYPLVASEVLVETFEEGDCISTYVDRGPGAMFNSRYRHCSGLGCFQRVLRQPRYSPRLPGGYCLGGKANHHFSPGNSSTENPMNSGT